MRAGLALWGTSAAVGVALLAVLPAQAQESQEAELAKKTLNPVASLISLPVKFDYDSNIGPAEEGNKAAVTIQPVLPFSISADWNLISRTLIPLINQRNLVPGTADEEGAVDVAGSGTQEGIGDITQQFYFSPKQPTAGGWIWGIGPQVLLPTGADKMTANKWGLGPTAVILKQASGWTYGGMANQMWSVSGNTKPDLSVLYVQPFLAYTTRTYTTVGINTESIYNWKTSNWSVPANLTLTQILKIGRQPLSVQAGVRYWVSTPDYVGPKNLGYRLQITLLFPK